MTDSHPSRRMKQQDRTTEYVKLEEHGFSVKKRFLAMYKKAHAGHIGSSLPCGEILVFLKYQQALAELTHAHGAAVRGYRNAG